MSRFSPHICRTAGVAVCQSKCLAEALDQNPYKTIDVRSVWDTVCTNLWHIKNQLDHAEEVNRSREGLSYGRC